MTPKRGKKFCSTRCKNEWRAAQWHYLDKRIRRGELNKEFVMLEYEEFVSLKDEQDEQALLAAGHEAADG